MSTRQGAAAQQQQQNNAQQQQNPNAGPGPRPASAPGPSGEANPHHRRRLAALHQLQSLLEDEGSIAYQTVAAFSDLLDEHILDVAQEVHREACTGTLPPPLYQPAPPPAPTTCPEASPTASQPQPQPVGLPPKPGTRGPVDVFGNSHPAKATDVVTCRNCGRQVQAGSFAPHLEKCMGKGRAAARAASRRLAGQS